MNRFVCVFYMAIGMTLSLHLFALEQPPIRITLRNDLIKDCQINPRFAKLTDEKWAALPYSHVCNLAQQDSAVAAYIAEQYLNATYPNPMDLNSAVKSRYIEKIATQHIKYVKQLRGIKQNEAKKFVDAHCLMNGFEGHSYITTFLFLLVAGGNNIPNIAAKERLRSSAEKGEYAAIVLLAWLNELSAENEQEPEDWDLFLYHAVDKEDSRMVEFLLNKKDASPKIDFSELPGNNAYARAAFRKNNEIMGLLLKKCPYEFIQPEEQVVKQENPVLEGEKPSPVDAFPVENLESSGAGPTADNSERKAQQAALGAICEIRVIENFGEVDEWEVVSQKTY